MLGAAADGLHRAPHVAALGEQIPPRRDELVGVDPARLVDRLQRSVNRIFQDDRPDLVAVALDDGVGAAETLCFFGIERGVNAAVDDHRPLGSHRRADFIAPERVARVDADAHHVPGLHAVEIERLQRFIRDPGVAMGCRGRASQDKQPTGGNHPDAKGQMARIY